MYVCYFLILVATVTPSIFGYGGLELVPSIIISAIMIVFFSALVIASIAVYKSNKKLMSEHYIIRDCNGQYKFDVEEIDGKLFVKNLYDKKRHKILSVDGEECSICDIDGELLVDIGMYQYLVPPKDVVKDLYLSPKDCFRPVGENIMLYKRKKVCGNTVYYRFCASSQVIGARYARCVKIKDGVIKYVTTQTCGSRNYKGALNFVYCKYTYSLVNDFSVKIYLSRYAKEYAEKHNFVLPIESDNFGYEESI